MRNATDNLLIQRVKDLYGERLDPNARAMLDNPTTQLSTSRYARDHWTFRCSALAAFIRVRQFPTGSAWDIRVFEDIREEWYSGVQA